MSARDTRALAELEAGGAADALEALEALTGYAEARADGATCAPPSAHAGEARAVLRRIHVHRLEVARAMDRRVHAELERRGALLPPAPRCCGAPMRWHNAKIGGRGAFRCAECGSTCSGAESLPRATR